MKRRIKLTWKARTTKAKRQKWTEQARKIYPDAVDDGIVLKFTAERKRDTKYVWIFLLGPFRNIEGRDQ